MIIHFICWAPFNNVQMLYNTSVEENRHRWVLSNGSYKSSSGCLWTERMGQQHTKLWTPQVCCCGGLCGAGGGAWSWLGVWAVWHVFEWTAGNKWSLCANNLKPKGLKKKRLFSPESYFVFWYCCQFSVTNPCIWIKSGKHVVFSWTQ